MLYRVRMIISGLPYGISRSRGRFYRQFRDQIQLLKVEIFKIVYLHRLVLKMLVVHTLHPAVYPRCPRWDCEIILGLFIRRMYLRGMISARSRYQNALPKHGKIIIWGTTIVTAFVCPVYLLTDTGPRLEVVRDICDRCAAAHRPGMFCGTNLRPFA